MMRVARAPASVALLATLALSVAGIAMSATAAHAASVAPVDLGRAAPFAILAGGSVGNTVTGPVTVVRGDLGVLAPAGALIGFPPGEVRGTLFATGAPAVLSAHR